MNEFLSILPTGTYLAVYVLGALALLLVLVFLAFTAYLHYVHWKYSHLPQPKRPSFYLGHTLDIINAQKESGNDEISISKLVEQWVQEVGGQTFVVFFAHRAVVITTDPECVKTVAMSTQHGKHPSHYRFISYLMGERFLGNGLVTLLDYETWKPRRQVFDPAFKKSYLKTLMDPFNEIVNRFIERLKLSTDGDTNVPMKLKFSELTLEVISKVAFGTDFTLQLTKQETLKLAKGDGTMTYLIDFALKGIQKSINIPGYRYLHPFKAAEYREVSRSVRAIGRDCIKTRIQMVESGERVPNDILTHILQGASNRENVDIEELVDDFVTFYVAGQETTANLLTFALVLTHLHPNVLERVQAEVDEVLGTKSYVSANDLEKLEYTEQVLKESLRLYGPAVITTRKIATGGVTLGGYHVSEGSELMLCTAAMCRMPQYFDDPDTFNPSRFDPDNQQPSSFVYFPFGVGHRTCLGRHFAMMEAKMAFSRLIQTFNVTLPENYEIVAALRTTLQTKDNVLCVLENRM